MKIGIGIGLTTRQGVSGSSPPALDPDAAAYISAVETADGQALEAGVKTAINDFVVGCKADAIWNAIKASCILAGARTLSGALVPLAGAAPTNVNFVSADYNRKTGLKGDGATKYLDSNRANNADPQNSKHLSIYATEGTTGQQASIGATVLSPLNYSQIVDDNSDMIAHINRSGTAITTTGGGVTTGFIGVSRSSSALTTLRMGGANLTNTAASVAPNALDIYVFARNLGGSPATHTGRRLSFYSIGEAIDLAALDTRVSALMTALDGEIA